MQDHISQRVLVVTCGPLQQTQDLPVEQRLFVEDLLRRFNLLRRQAALGEDFDQHTATTAPAKGDQQAYPGLQSGGLACWGIVVEKGAQRTGEGDAQNRI